MKRMWMVGVLALLLGAVAAAPAGAAAGGNSANAKLCQNGGWKTLFRSDGSRSPIKATASATPHRAMRS